MQEIQNIIPYFVFVIIYIKDKYCYHITIDAKCIRKVIILLFIYGYISVVTFFLIYCGYKLYKQNLKRTSQIVIRTKVVTKNISQREMIKQNKEKKRLKDSSYDEVFRSCKEIASTGEVTYFTLEDIQNIVASLKSNN